MIQIDVEIRNRPGELGKLAQVLGEAGVNIGHISAQAGKTRAYVSLIVDQTATARSALKAAGYAAAQRTVLIVRLKDKPAALGELARRLGDAGVNIDSVVHLETAGGFAQLAIGVDDLAKARGLV
ncbi:MAG: hypothetical protein A3K59_03230 [Euryarchaeota archaeon RBG_19FT_COMBO_69_17]|nr:MAG: hypothetical protein A3K59_03230 [Euryarchaeota archaeon RBG_19FT_COMBO_69_17]